MKVNDTVRLSVETEPAPNGRGVSRAAGVQVAGALRGNPLVSIVIPVYQEEKLLRDTLEIFTAERRARWGLELIVSDGGSTDGTLAIAECYADKIVRHTRKGRQTIAEGRNAGAREAEGDTLVFLNGDTVPADPEVFFAAVHAWRSSTRTATHVALACPVNVAPPERERRDRIFHTFFNAYVRVLNCIGFGMGRGECQVVRAWAFTRVGGYNQAIAAGEDFDLFRRLAAIGKIGFRAETLVYESPRRFRKYGYLHVLGSWFVNALSVLVRKRAVSDEWEAVR